jgi:hypothetical protein
MKKRDTLEAYIKFEENSEFGNPWRESIGFKCDTPIMFGLNSFQK